MRDQVNPVGETLTVMTWNMASRGVRLWDKVEAEGPDIAVLQECPRPAEIAARHPDFARRWRTFHEETSNRSCLLVAVRAGLPAKLHAVPDPTIKFALAVEIGLPEPLRLLAVHIYNHRAEKLGGSPTPLPDAHARHGAWLRQGRAMVVGDINNEPSFERFNTGPKRAPNRFTEIASTFRDLGLASAWHHLNGEEFGSETRHTLIRSTGRYHIDYAWASDGLLADASCEIGAPDDWTGRGLSDHAPVFLRTRSVIW